MQRLFSIILGVGLIVAGVVTLALNLALPLWNIHLIGAWRLWPLAVVAVGLLFTLPPVLVSGQRGLGALFIPGLPVLATGGILLLGSLFNRWGVWHWLWPVEVLAVAAGFILAAGYLRVVWLLIPAIFIGLNGLVLQFCAVTGWWSAWQVLWTVEPLAVGLVLCLVAFKTRSAAVFAVALTVCALSGVAALGMLALFSGLWRLGFTLSAVGLILLGIALLVWNVIGPRPAPPTQAPAWPAARKTLNSFRSTHS